MRRFLLIFRHFSTFKTLALEIHHKFQKRQNLKNKMSKTLKFQNVKISKTVKFQKR